MPTLSTLELMLEEIQRREDQQKDVPPALPTRPVIRARLPRSRSRLAFNSQKKYCEGNEDQCTSSSLEGSKRPKSGDFVDSLHHQESSDRVRGAGASAFLVKFVNGSVDEFDSRKNEDDTAKKIGEFDDAKETALQQILGIQEHQTWLDRGVITLQSFIRGESSRKYFAKKMMAIGVIQKRVKGWFRSGVLEEKDQAVVLLQTSIRGWLARQHFNSMDGQEKLPTEDARNVKNLDVKDKVMAPYSVLVDLQRRVLKTEALLDEKREENASLRLQIKQLERKRQQYETKMKSMEKTWQDQLTSIQKSLAEAKKSSSSKNAVGKLGLLFALPENSEENENENDPPSIIIKSLLNSDHIIEHRRGLSLENACDHLNQNSDTNQEEELQKLNLKFRTWKRDFKTKLWAVKTTIKKLLNAETGRNSSQNKWRVR